MNAYAIRSALVGALGVAFTLTSGPALARYFRITDLGTLGGGSSTGHDMNASGQVTGVANTAANESHAFLWDGTTMQDLGTLGGTRSSGPAINDSGQVTGEAITAGDAANHAFLWDGTGCRTSARWGAA